MKSAEVPLDALTVAVKVVHRCKAVWVESVPVTETFQGQSTWEGTVEVFELADHPTASRCYAWSHLIGDARRKIYAVLHEGPVDSPQAAVRAAIVAEHHSKGAQREKP